MYSIDLDAPDAELDAAWALLNEVEQARAERFVTPQLRSRWVFARAGLRKALAPYCSEAPAGLAFEEEEFGKPVLADATLRQELHFNLSHSNGLGLVGITRIAPLGVDLEYQRELRNCEEIAERICSPAELSQLLALPEDERQAAFYRCWTRKEAVIKATGMGFSADLQAITVALAPGDPARVLAYADAPGKAWVLEHLELTDGFVGAVALQSPDEVVIVRS